MCYIIRNARKLFYEMAQQNYPLINCICSLYHTSAGNKSTYYEDPIDFYQEIDNLISCSSKISNLVRKCQHEQAISFFKAMLMSGRRPNFVTLVSVIRAFGAFHCQDKIRVVHGYVIKMGFEIEVPVLTALLGLYSIFDIGIAWKLFDQIPNKDVVLWTAMVSACVKNGKYMEAIDSFRRMQCYDMEANHVSVVSVLPACAYLGRLNLGKEIHGFVIKRLLYSVTNVRNSLVDMYAKCGELEASIQVFDGTWKKDLISWRSMIHGCLHNECPQRGLNNFLKMLCSCFQPDLVIICDTIVATLEAEELKFGLGFHGYIVKKGFLAFISVGTALMQMYGKLGEFVSAQSIFDQLNCKDLIAWSALISLYAQGGHPDNALSAFKHMQAMNEKPNEITFVSLLQACSAMGAQALAESIHCYITKVGYSSNTHLMSALIDLYCKSGKIEQGMFLFGEISTKDLICWSSMIKGYGLNGYGLEALEAFSNMLDNGVKPNDVVFISILSACSQCGLEYEGFIWFYSMEEKYGVTPKLAHYACMVDLLCRQGNIEEAFDFVNKMPMEPDKRIWENLLAGCKSRGHGSVEIAKIVVEKLSAMEPKNTSYYLILSNLYAEEGRWEDIERLGKLVGKKNFMKTAEYVKMA